MQINIEKRYIATIISIILLLAFAGYVIAVTGVSHTADEIISVDWSQITNRPAGLDDGDDVGGIEGGAVLWFNNVGTLLKDGANIPEFSCKGDTIFYYYGRAKVQNGKVYTRARVLRYGVEVYCDSGWIQGTKAECFNQRHPAVYMGEKSTIKVDSYGATLTGTSYDGYGRPSQACTSSGKWT